MLLSLLISGYATGTFSNRKIERATHDSRAFRDIAYNRYPDHGALATFMRRFCTVNLDGTEIHANACRHNALCLHACGKDRREAESRMQESLALEESADQTSLPDGVKLQEEIRRREDRLAAITEAKE